MGKEQCNNNNSKKCSKTHRVKNPPFLIKIMTTALLKHFSSRDKPKYNYCLYLLNVVYSVKVYNFLDISMKTSLTYVSIYPQLLY